MRKLLYYSICFMFFFSSYVVAESDVTYEEGIDYQVITPAQPTDDPTKIEVVEVFWYGCPHCNHFEPTLEPWIQKAPEDVRFYRLPAIFAPVWEVHARAYFTAEILDVLEQSHADFFYSLHTKKEPLNTVDRLADFYAKYGVDKDLFKKTYHSFVVNTRVSRSKDLVDRYGATGVPALVVDGKYLVTGPMAKSYQNMVNIADFLIEKERKER